MSAYYFYKTLGYSPAGSKRAYINSGGSNTVIWTPTSSMRIALTNLNISSNPGGTIQIWFGGNNQIKLAEFNVGGSSTIYPSISSWESTAIDAPLFAIASVGGTNGWSISAEGFELD